ncbi:MAG TPA: hypothetical protein DDW97_00855 [Anaerolineaceae bacterium]|nr:hypothetical protein [Anaerolineaceae bacterium]
MTNLEEQTPPTKKKTWRFVIILIVLGLAVNLLLPQISNFTEAWSVVKTMTWWAVGLAVLSEVISYLSYGYCIHAIVASRKQKLSVPKSTLIVMSATSVGLVAGGWVTLAGSIFSSVKRETGDNGTATISGLLPSMLLNMSIALIAIFGLVYLGIIGQLTNGQLIQYVIFLFVLMLITFGSLLVVVFPKFTYKVINWALWHWNKWRKKPYDPQKTQEMLDNLIFSWKEMGRGNWKKPFLGAFFYTLFDLLAMYLIFIAAGYNIKIGVLFASYGLPYLLAKIAFIFPGGIGVVEATMAAIQTSLGVPSQISVVVILVYRLFSFWLPTLLGFAAMGYLNHNQPAIAPEEPFIAQLSPANPGDPHDETL